MTPYIEISDLSYHICRRFHIHVPDLFTYLIKTVGDHRTEPKKRKIKEGKRRYKRMRSSVTHHLKRKHKSKPKQPYHETAESF